MLKPLKRLADIGELVKFSHSIFALPFALSSAWVASGGFPPIRTLIWLLIAMVSARTSAMAFNRILDADIDAKNPRTAGRHIPQGLLSRRFVGLLTLASAAVFILAAGMLNRFCLLLSPLALAILFFYSFTKRFTHWSHLFLGLALGMSAPAAWIAVSGGLQATPLVLGLAVLLWVAGFDIIYATQDAEFDQQEGLHSLVVRLGVAKSLQIARLFHGVTVGLLILFGTMAGLGLLYTLALVLVSLLLIYEHSLVKANNLSRVNAAFFNVNGLISLLFLAGVVLDVSL